MVRGARLLAFSAMIFLENVEGYSRPAPSALSSTKRKPKVQWRPTIRRWCDEHHAHEDDFGGGGAAKIRDGACVMIGGLR